MLNIWEKSILLGPMMSIECKNDLCRLTYLQLISIFIVRITLSDKENNHRNNHAYTLTLRKSSWFGYAYVYKRAKRIDFHHIGTVKVWRPLNPSPKHFQFGFLEKNALLIKRQISIVLLPCWSTYEWFHIHLISSLFIIWIVILTSPI